MCFRGMFVENTLISMDPDTAAAEDKDTDIYTDIVKINR